MKERNPSLRAKLLILRALHVTEGMKGLLLHLRSKHGSCNKGVHDAHGRRIVWVVCVCVAERGTGNDYIQIQGEKLMAAGIAVLEVPETQDTKTSTGEKTDLKRLNLNLAPKAFQELQALAKKTNRSMTELVRIGLGLARIANEAREQGLRLAVVDDRGNSVRDIVIP